MSTNGGNTSASNTPKRFAIGWIIIWTIVPIVFAAIHVWNQNLAIDNTTLGLLLLGAIPWLGEVLAHYVESIKGHGWEVRFREVEEHVKEAKIVAQEGKAVATGLLHVRRMLL